MLHYNKRSALSFLQISIEASSLLKLLDPNTSTQFSFINIMHFPLNLSFRSKRELFNFTLKKEFHNQSRPYIESISLSLSASLSKPSKLTEFAILQPQFPNCICQGINQCHDFIYLFCAAVQMLQVI